MQASNGAIVQAVSKNKYAVGYIGLGYLDKTVKALTVNGIEASAHTVLSKTYPIARPLYVFTDGQPKGETAKFVAFLISPDGQKIVAREGFVPLAGPAKKK
jgi:phosphate transport system substrate-binding protein